jgi:ribonuclease D
LEKDYKEIPNPLVVSDKFEPSGRAYPSRPISAWFSMKDCDMQESDVTLIDTEQTLEQATQKILKDPKGQFVGFDSESFDPKLNDREGHIALIQIATKDHVFLFDCVALKDSGEFHLFLEKFFTTRDFKILAHTFHGDIRDINMTFGININPKACGNVVDLTKVIVYTNGYNIGLAKMVELFLGKKLCK